MGNPVGVKGRSLEGVTMKSADGETEIDLTYSAVLDEKAGKVMI